MENIFVREDIAKPENRFNLALFHLQIDEDFHKWFCQKLNIPENSVIYPTENLEGDRPDFIIKDGHKTIGYIEVELGDENKAQLNSYRHKYENNNVHIFSISGKTIQKSDLSLEEIKNHLFKKLETINTSQKVLSVKYLIKLIDTYSNNYQTYSRSPVSNEMLERPFINKLLEALIDFKPNGNQNKAIPGTYYCDTNSPKGFSFRVYSKESKVQTKSISLLSITKGREYITFLSAEKYRIYLNHKENELVENWINFIKDTLKLPVHKLSFNQRLEAELSSVDQHMEKLVAAIIPLI